MAVKEHEIVYSLTDYEVSVVRGAIIERGEKWPADEETCKGLLAITDDQLGPEDEDGGWDVLKSGDARAGRVALIVNEEIVELTTGMYRALCGLVHPSDAIDPLDVTADEEDWQRLRELFPLANAHTVHNEGWEKISADSVEEGDVIALGGQHPSRDTARTVASVRSSGVAVYVEYVDGEAGDGFAYDDRVWKSTE